MMAGSISTWIKRHALFAYFLLAYSISWAIQIPLAFQAQGLSQASIPFSTHYLSAYGPMLSAIIVTWLTGGIGGLKELMGRMLIWRVQPVYWLAAISPLALYVIVALVLWLIQGNPLDLSVLGQVDFLPKMGWGVLPFWLLTSG
ncbi:MAG TPA: hypothetical protein VN363_00130, partial [Anaerolineales bacterium]|nr:hypothetical protein [Anaerolineales bacterium]